MLRTQEVVNGLDRVKGADRHFNEEGIPFRHCTIPQARQLEGEQFFSVFRLLGDEARLRVYEVGEVEGLAVDIAGSAYEVHGVEVGSLRGLLSARTRGSVG